MASQTSGKGKGWCFGGTQYVGLAGVPCSESSGLLGLPCSSISLLEGLSCMPAQVVPLLLLRACCAAAAAGRRGAGGGCVGGGATSCQRLPAAAKAADSA